MTAHYQFFELQRHYKRNSLILYFLFVMAMMIHVLVALLVLMAIWYLLFGGWTEFLWFWVIVIVPSYFILNVLYHYNKITHNHDAILKGIEVKRLFVNVSGLANLSSQNVICVNDIKEFAPKYRRYYQFAEQLAIASNITLPKLYVMDDKGINAFVAGFDDNDMMLVVSEGALKLDNESLYGLIGHEYGHILHGDARLNVKMYVLMSGLSWLYDVADGLERASQWRQTPKVNRYYLKDEHGRQREYVSITGVGRLSIEFVSLLIRLLGFLGMASSEWIKQHFNRQREFLADATSTQLTRSDGVIKLLTLLQQNPYLNKNKKRYTTHLSYFFFLNPHDDTVLNWRERISHMSDTHPTNIERIGTLKLGEYDDFAKMVIDGLDIDVLQRTHEAMMSLTTEGVMDVVNGDFDATILIHQSHQDDSHDDKKSIIIPIYDKSIELSHDRVVDGRLIVDECWKNLQASDDVVYPMRAKADHELLGVKYVDVNHIKKMHLPLIINRYLHNNTQSHNLSKLFALYYAIIICHDKLSLNIDDKINLSELFSLDTHDEMMVLDKQLLKAVALMDRRIDNGLLLIIYQRISQDLQDDKKNQMLMNDFSHLTNFIKNNHGKNSDDDLNQLTILWKGIHLYCLLSLYDDCELFYQSWFDEFMMIGKDCRANNNEWVVIVLLVKIVISHHNNHDYHIHTIYRHIRLTNPMLNIKQSDLEKLISDIHQWGILEMALLLMFYDENNQFISQRHIETLHTALLGNGRLDECDYEILLTLSHQWCPNHHFMPTQ